jgi:hypothetical protein
LVALMTASVRFVTFNSFRMAVMCLFAVGSARLNTRQIALLLFPLHQDRQDVALSDSQVLAKGIHGGTSLPPRAAALVRQIARSTICEKWD